MSGEYITLGKGFFPPLSSAVAADIFRARSYLPNSALVLNNIHWGRIKDEKSIRLGIRWCGAVSREINQAIWNATDERRSLGNHNAKANAGSHLKAGWQEGRQVIAPIGEGKPVTCDLNFLRAFNEEGIGARELANKMAKVSPVGKRKVNFFTRHNKLLKSTPPFSHLCYSFQPVYLAQPCRVICGCNGTMYEEIYANTLSCNAHYSCEAV